jgi:hypothetical protein
VSVPLKKATHGQEGNKEGKFKNVVARDQARAKGLAENAKRVREKKADKSED